MVVKQQILIYKTTVRNSLEGMFNGELSETYLKQQNKRENLRHYKFLFHQYIVSKITLEMYWWNELITVQFLTLVFAALNVYKTIRH